ncbi:MAG: phosphoglycerate dehydrogenase [Chloroflexi bacterium]|nr:phosphoglycerate dehydrogenase [Chloroflexota bacterium]
MMMKQDWRVLIGSRSFGKRFPEHIRRLEHAGCEVIPNRQGRAYRAEELLEVLPGMDAIITGTDELTAEVLNAAPGLKTIAKHGVGLDSIDMAAAQAQGIIVSATPGTNHQSVADLTLALLLALARGVVQSHNDVVSGGWQAFYGMELQGKTLGIVGFGRIGRAVCVRAQAFGMQVVACDPYADKTWAKAHFVPFISLAELLAQADVVTLHAAADMLDHPLIAAPELKAMKPTALLINTARGALVDEEALVWALRTGQIAAAGLDAFDQEPPAGSPLLELDNVVLTAHLGGRTVDAQRRQGEMCIENLLRALKGKEPLHRVV